MSFPLLRIKLIEIFFSFFCNNPVLNLELHILKFYWKEKKSVGMVPAYLVTNLMDLVENWLSPVKNQIHFQSWINLLDYQWSNSTWLDSGLKWLRKIVLEKGGLWNSVFVISKVLVLNQSQISVVFQIVLFSFAKKIHTNWGSPLPGKLWWLTQI